jgi:hypothetical protein
MTSASSPHHLINIKIVNRHFLEVQKISLEFELMQQMIESLQRLGYL